jgi:hypothetical protein
MALYTRRLNTLVVEDETLQKLLHERRLLPYFTLYANRHRALHENYLDEHGFVKFKVPSRLSSSSLSLLLVLSAAVELRKPGVRAGQQREDYSERTSALPLRRELCHDDKEDARRMVVAHVQERAHLRHRRPHQRLHQGKPRQRLHDVP